MMLLCANPLCCSSVLLLCAAPSQLAICRALVEAMGGCIFVKSKPRVGSCFSFAIPLLLPPPLAPSCGGAVKGVGRISSHVSNLEAAVALEMPPFPSSVHYSRTESTLPVGPVWGGGKERRRGLVLVVEDDDMSYEVVSAFLDRLCFDNVRASTGARALELLCGYTSDSVDRAPNHGGSDAAALHGEGMDGPKKKELPLLRPCCVLMDVGLPDTSGMDVTRKIRTWERRCEAGKTTTTNAFNLADPVAGDETKCAAAAVAAATAAAVADSMAAAVADSVRVPVMGGGGSSASTLQLEESTEQRAPHVVVVALTAHTLDGIQER